MAMTTAFDTLRYAKRLEAAKVPVEQAEAQSAALAEVLEERDRALAGVQSQVQALAQERKRDAEQMATKADIAGVKSEIALVRKEVEIGNKDLLIKLGSIIGAAVLAILAAMRWMPHA